MAQEFIKTIQKIPWFVACGRLERLTVSNWQTRQVRASEALELAAGDAWYALQQGAVGDLQRHVFQHDREQHKLWPIYNKETRALLEEPFSEVLRAMRAAQLPELLLDMVKLQLAMSCMETRFAALKPPVYFGRLLEVYAAGHFPCGWHGNLRSDLDGPRPLVADYVLEAELAYY